jgi:hypothetical protein
MTLLNIFHTGGITLSLTIFWLGLTGLFAYQTFKAHKSGWNQQTPTGIKEGNEKIKITAIPQFWFAVAVTVLYLIAMIFVAIDYKGV